MSGDVQVIPFESRFAKAFADLNYEWIEAFFTVEKHDREILDDPQTWVIDVGGEIFIALVGDTAAGTVAMIPAGAGILELTKMAVSPDFQRRGIGDALMTAAIDYGREQGVDKIFLETHHKLQPAIQLYHKHGFIATPPDPNSLYSRADVRMELELKAPSR